MNYYTKEKGNKKGNLIYGYHPIVEALEAGKTIDKILLKKGSKAGRIIDMAKARDIPIQEVPEASLNRFSRGSNHQGAIAFVAAITYQKLEDIILKLEASKEKALFVMLDGVTDVRNFGAIARSAECMGAHAIVVPTRGAAAGNADAVKTSAGALNHIPVCREVNLVDAVLLMQSYGVAVVSCTEKASQNIFEEDFTGPTCIILGSEDKGISSTLIKRSDKQVKIPLVGKVSSLNVSVAAGMALSEALRQRGYGGK